FGSNFTSVTPRSDASEDVPLQKTGPCAGQSEPPSQIKLKCPPPSTDLNNPKGGRFSGGFEVPPPVTDEMPRTPRVDETYMINGFVGSITIEAIERPTNAFPE